MKLIKKHIYVDEEGRLKLPLEFIKTAEIQPGSKLKITLIIPEEFLLAADISPDSDLEITCTPGTITIKESDILNRLPENLSSLFRSFGISPETVREVMKQEGYFI